MSILKKQRLINELIKMTAEINTNGKLSRELARAVTRADFVREQERLMHFILQDFKIKGFICIQT